MEGETEDQKKVREDREKAAAETQRKNAQDALREKDSKARNENVRNGGGDKTPSGNSQSEASTKFKEMYERKKKKREMAAVGAANERFEGKDPISRPSLSDISEFQYEPASSDVATINQIDEISGYVKKLGVPEEKVALVMWDIARHCADCGSSGQSALVGVATNSGEVPRSVIASCVKKVCTLRQFCAFFAKIVWNIMLDSECPPANWGKWGYKEDAKYAAFDFFYGVTHNASLEPSGGLIRPPTYIEMVANQTAKSLHLHRQGSRLDKSASSFLEVSGGRTGPRERLMLKGMGDK
nr:MAG: coat protein [Dracophyllum betaflexi-like virus]